MKPWEKNEERLIARLDNDEERRKAVRAARLELLREGARCKRY